MASFVKFNSFVEALAEKVHNLGSDQLKIALTNTDPTASATNYAGLTSPLPTTNLSGATPFNVTTSSSSRTGGTYKLVCADLTLTATPWPVMRRPHDGPLRSRWEPTRPSMASRVGWNPTFSTEPILSCTGRRSQSWTQ